MSDDPDLDAAAGLVFPARERDLGGFSVGRVLPYVRRRMVGPFIFLDHLGPLQLPAPVPRSADVRPHPHIGLATVTYLIAGELTHRDSLGVEQLIRPGEVNWMTAGRGISHSERFDSMRDSGGAVHGLQAWVALARRAGGDRAGLRALRPRADPDDHAAGRLRQLDRRLGIRRDQRRAHALAVVLRAPGAAARCARRAARRVPRARRIRRQRCGGVGRPSV